MRRLLFISSFLLLAAATTSFLEDSSVSLLSRGAAILLVAAVVVLWVAVLWHFFRSTSMSKREKAAAWLSVGFLICALLSSLHVTFWVYMPGWATVLEWHTAWLLLAFAFAVTAAFVAPKLSIPNHAPYTVESEAPDHVIHATKRA
jgi:hypothetical protein